MKLVLMFMAEMRVIDIEDDDVEEDNCDRSDDMEDYFDAFDREF